MSCKNSPFSSDILSSENQGGSKTIVYGEGGEIFVREVKEGDATAYYVSRQVYEAPGIALLLTPSSIEKGKVMNKNAIGISLDVTKGRDEVGSIQVPAVAENVTNPVLPYSNSWAFPSTDPLGQEEEVSISATIQDSKTHNVSTKAGRTTRFITGVINKDPRVATVDELKAAASATTDGHPGVLVTGIPSSMTFNCNSNYWFILHPKTWSGFSLKDPATGFVLSPIHTDKGAVVMNPDTSFSQQYTVSSVSNKSAGPLTFQKI